MTTRLTIPTLYEQDYYLWLEITLKLLQEQDLAHLDWEHLIEEIEGLGNEQRRKAESYLRQLLIHLLLHQYWTSERAYCRNGWKAEIRNFRVELEFLLRAKTLYNYLQQQFDSVYDKARKIAIDKTGLSTDMFPVICPFTFEEVLNPNFLPDIKSN